HAGGNRAEPPQAGQTRRPATAKPQQPVSRNYCVVRKHRTRPSPPNEPMAGDRFEKSASAAAWLKDMFLPPDVLEWPLNVVVVRSGGRTILIDAGLGVEFPDFPRAGRLALRLEAAGIDLASVTDVVLTHLHMDHVGGLLVDGVRDRLRP